MDKIDQLFKRFYFIAYVTDKKLKVTVIELTFASANQRKKYKVINDVNYGNLATATNHAKIFSEKQKIEYKPFKPRYIGSSRKIN